jgi:DNA-nicking Smr family endonuclease
MTDRRKGRRLSEEDRALWESVTRSIKPLRERLRKLLESDAPVAKEPARAVPASRRVATSPPAAAPEQKPAPSLAPLERKLKQRLRRGRADIDARLDLHGYTQAEAHDRLRRFLRGAQDKGAIVVLVITGKGAMSSDGERGVLKRQVPLWLGLPEFRDYVVGFDVASAAHGGEGALYVRLRKKRRD